VDHNLHQVERFALEVLPAVLLDHFLRLNLDGSEIKLEPFTFERICLFRRQVGHQDQGANDVEVHANAVLCLLQVEGSPEIIRQFGSLLRQTDHLHQSFAGFKCNFFLH